MNEEINKEILDKIENYSTNRNVKDFLFEVLDLEYDKLDEARPQLKNEYEKLIKKHKG